MMFTLGLLLVIGVGVYAAAGNGEYGSVLIGIVLAVLIVLMGRAVKRDAIAHANIVEYWQKRR